MPKIMIFPKKYCNNHCFKIAARSVSSRRVKGTVEIPDAKRITEPWNERKETWMSKFSFLESKKLNALAPDTIRFLQTPIDLSPSNVKRWYENKLEVTEDEDQSFNEKRYDILGPDLAAAHFVVHRGGSIKFFDDPSWVKKKDDKTQVLPNKYIPGLHVEAIDCSTMTLRTTGLENILDLPKLQRLILANNKLVDDWSMDGISGSYAGTLLYLDICGCPNVTHRGLSCFYRFEKLETLVVDGLARGPEFKLSCLMLEEIRPKLTIKGINYDSKIEPIDVTK